MNEENIQAIEEEIFQIRAKLVELKKKKAEYEEEAARNLEKREKIHLRIKEIKEKNSFYLDRISSLKGEITELRAKLDEVVTKIKEMRNEKRKLLSQHMAGSVKGYTAQEIMRRIRDLEERIETDILRPEEERRIYDELRNLSNLLAEIQKREEVAEKLREINNSMEPLVEESKKIKESIRMKGEELQALREALQSVKDMIQELKPEADVYHNAYLEAKKKAQMAEAEEILLISRLYELQELVKKHRVAVLKAREYMLKEKAKSKALEKLSHGEKLSFEEMKVLMEDETAWDNLVKRSNVANKG